MTNNAIWESAEHLRIEFFAAASNPESRIAFVFSPSMNRSLEGNHFGGELLLRNGFDVLAFKVSDDSWFQTLTPEIFERIDAALAARQYRQRVAYGSSMGGYAAIQFSRRLGCHRVLALSPQFCVDQPFDRRWSAYIGNICWRHRISADSVAPDCQYMLVYDDRDPDQLHIDRLEPLIAPRQLFKLPLRYIGHPATAFLHQTGQLKELVLQALSGASIAGRNFRQHRQRSAAYMNSMSNHALARQRPQLALRLIDRAIALIPEMVDYHEYKSHILNRLGHLDAAIESAEDAIALAPDSVSLRTHISHLHARQGRLDLAIAAARVAIERAPGQPDCLSHCGNLLASQGALEQALHMVDQALQIAPDQPSFHFQRSGILGRLNRVAEAIASAEAALRLAPGGNALMLHHLSHLHARQSAWQEAIEVNQRALALAPEQADFMVHQSNLLCRNDAWQAALSPINQAIRLAPHVAEYYARKSAILERLGRLDEAVEAIRRAIPRDWDNAHLYASYSKLQFKQSTLEDALKNIDAAIDLNDKVAGFHLQQSLLLERLGLIDAAIAATERALALEQSLELQNRLDQLRLQATEHA